MAELFPSTSVKFEFRSDDDQLVARWQGPAEDEALRTDYTTVLALADQHRCGRWLLDLRRRAPHLDSLTMTWLNREFLPLLVGRYPGGLRVAYLLAPHLPDHTDALHAARLAQRHYPLPPGRMQVFVDEAAAVAWLMKR